MGRMKDLYFEVLQANNGEIPQEATIADLARMNDLKIYEWREYERSQNNKPLKLRNTIKNKSNQKSTNNEEGD
jgi:hypothetical protein